MHILLITSEALDEYNKFASCFELDQANALQKAGHKVTILSVGNISILSIAKAILLRISSKPQENYRLEHLNLFELFFLFFKALFFCISIEQSITRSLKIESIEVIEAFGYSFKSVISEKNWIKRGYYSFKKYCEKFNEPEVIHGHSRFLLAGLLAKEIFDKDNIKYVLTEHSTFYARDLIKDYQYPLIKDVIQHASKFIVVSESLGRTVNAKLKSNYPYSVIPNIVDSRFELDNNETSLKNLNFEILNIATLTEKKDHLTLLKAFKDFNKKYPNSILRIGGVGEMEDVLKKYTLSLELENQVEFLGQLTREQVKVRMNTCNLFVLSSIYETFGVVIIEALACGKPVVATKCGGPEEIIDNSNGKIVPIQDSSNLSKAMIDIFENIEKYDPKMIKLNCLNKYGSKAVVAKLLDVYIKTIKEEIVNHQ